MPDSGWIFEALTTVGHTAAKAAVGVIVFIIVFVFFCLGIDKDHRGW